MYLYAQNNATCCTFRAFSTLSSNRSGTVKLQDDYNQTSDI